MSVSNYVEPKVEQTEQNAETHQRKWVRKCYSRLPDVRSPCVQIPDSPSSEPSEPSEPVEMVEFHDSSVHKRLNGCCIGLRLKLASDNKPAACKWDLTPLDVQQVLQHDIRSRLFFAKSLDEKMILKRLLAQFELPEEQIRCFEYLSLDHLPEFKTQSRVTCLLVDVATGSHEKAWFKFLAWTKNMPKLKCVMINDLTGSSSHTIVMHDVRSSRFNLTYIKCRTMPGQSFMTTGDHPKAKLFYTLKPLHVWKTTRTNALESNLTSVCTQLTAITQTCLKTQAQRLSI